MWPCALAFVCALVLMLVSVLTLLLVSVRVWVLVLHGVEVGTGGVCVRERAAKGPGNARCAGTLRNQKAQEAKKLNQLHGTNT